MELYTVVYFVQGPIAINGFVALLRQSAIKTVIFIAAAGYLGNNAPAVFSQHRNHGK
jgi:hypothetical protein